MTQLPRRGEINHNPFDLEDDGTDWDGLDTPRVDGKLLRFKTDLDGLIAGGKDIRNSWKKRGPTIESVIRHFAPPNENDTDAYIADVLKFTGTAPGAPVDLNNVADLGRFMTAFIRQEQGRVIYSPLLIAEAAKAVLGQQETTPMPTQSPSINASHVVATGGIMGALTQVILYISHWPLQPMTEGQAGSVAVLVIALYGACVWCKRKPSSPLPNGGDASGA